MFKLLNRISWIVSLFAGIIGILIFYPSGFNNFGLFFIIVGIFIGMLFKHIFLSRDFIEERLKIFAEALKESPHPNPLPMEEGTGKVDNGDKSFEIENEYDNRVEDIQELEVPLDYNGLPINVNNEKEVVIPLKSEKVKEKVEKYDPSQLEIIFSKLGLGIKKFFSENILAKIGGILVFFSVLFFLSLIYSIVGDLMKIVIGFIVGFIVYFTGVTLEKKGYDNEGKILLGIAILINYLVILSGKYILGGDGSGYLSEGITLIFLIFNTVFAVVTSLVYKSKILLIFSFIFAYLNPFLVGGSASDPYSLVMYSSIVSIGAMFLGIKQKDIILILGSFILGNVIFLLAPYSNEMGWITKVVASMALGFGSIFSIYKIGEAKNILGGLFILNYIVLVLHLTVNVGGLSNITNYLIYMSYILSFFILGIFCFLRGFISSIFHIFLLPIFIVFILIISGNIFSIPLTFGIIVLVYLLGFRFIESKLSNIIKYVYLLILGLFVFSTNFFSFFSIGIDMSFIEYIVTVIISFVFIFSSYFLSNKKGLGYMYSIGTILGILILLPLIFVVNENTNYVLISIISIVIFFISNIIVPFVNKNIKEYQNIIVGSILMLLFISLELYRFGTEYFPGISLGFAFIGLAIIYFVLGIFISKKLGINSIEKTGDVNLEEKKNILMGYLLSSISLFSFAIALVFSGHREIISLAWLFETTILLYFFNKTQNIKIFISAIILFIIGIVNLTTLSVVGKDFMFLVPFSLIFISLIINIKFLDNIKDGFIRVSHDILHIIGIGTLGSLLFTIIPNTGFGWNFFGISIFIMLLGFIYSYFSSNILKIYFIIIFSLFGINHISSLNGIFYTLGGNDLHYLIIIQYLVTIFLGIGVFVWNKINKVSIYNAILNIIYSIYLLFTLSYYIYDIFASTFIITIFWGIISYILLNYGIGKNLIKYRTIGLYLVSLVSIKIFLYDIWYAIDNNIVRVGAFMVIGIMFIIISTKYTKKYGNNLVGEFSFSNLLGDKEKEDINNDDNKGTNLDTINQQDLNKEEDKINKEDNVNKQDKINNKINNKINKKTEKQNNANKEYKINIEIENIDISDIKNAKLIFNSGKVIQTRSINLLKIIKLVLIEFGKDNFEKGELESMFIFVKDNYKTKINIRDYNKILNILEGFVKEGGSIELIKK